MKIQLIDNILWYDTASIGHANGLYLDKTDFKHLEQQRDVVIRTLLPGRMDMLFVAGDRVVGVESKYPYDLLNSHSTRRLARQLRDMRELVDIAVLMLRRATDSYEIIPFTKHDWKHNVDLVPWPLYHDLLRYQLMGVYLVVGPELDEDIPKWAVEVRRILSGESVRGALYGTDNVKKTNGKTLLRSIKGVGPALESRLIKHYGTVRNALLATDEEWYNTGVPTSVIKHRRDALD